MNLQRKAKPWVRLAMTKHLSMLALPDAPKAGSEEFDNYALAWESAFHRANTLDAEVERARLSVLADPPKWWRDQLPAILKAIDAERASNPAQPEFGVQVNDRAQAEKDSASCDLCSGSGWAEVFHRSYDGGGYVYDTASDGSEVRIRARFRLACHCPLGRWFLSHRERQASEAKGQDERTRLAKEARCLRGVEAVMAGRTEYTLFDPTVPTDVDVPQTKDWRAHVRAWADSKKTTV